MQKIRIEQMQKVLVSNGVMCYTFKVCGRVDSLQ